MELYIGPYLSANDVNDIGTYECKNAHMNPRCILCHGANKYHEQYQNSVCQFSAKLSLNYHILYIQKISHCGNMPCQNIPCSKCIPSHDHTRGHFEGDV